MEPYNEETKNIPLPEDSSIVRTGVIDLFTNIGNKEVHILTPVIGGCAIKVNEQSIIIDSAHLKALGQWLVKISDKLTIEQIRAHRFERGE